MPAPYWNIGYQTAVNAILIDAGVSNRGETGLLSAAELDEMGEAIRNNVGVTVFAGKIIERAAVEEAQRRGKEWCEENVEAAEAAE